ncbi:MAG: DUF4198 domain-containing protein [Thermodesulfobacteriaceae bacterium]|nr:DUF4198 domain-containing protein [Thermodesulfobacteriaceae bacterium]
MKKFLIGVLMSLFFISSTKAHFLVLIPEKDVIEKGKGVVNLEARFTHPMEGGPNMEFSIMESAFFIKEERNSLNWQRKSIPVTKGSTKKVSMYTGSLNFSKPGIYQVFVTSSPYFESSEGKYIQQIAKVILSVFGIEEGWDRPLGLKVEIVPLVKPFGLWEGNTFKGRVLIEGKPAKNVEVEVEYLNTKGVKPPVDSLITQVVKTDEMGYFEYTIPWAGWWGFSAITEKETIKGADGKVYPLEVGGVIWVRAYPKPKEVK